MSKRLVITRLASFENKVFSGVFDNHKLLDISCTDDNCSSVNVGDIYVAKVKQINKNINALFLDLKPGISSYLPIDELYDTCIVKKHSDKKRISEEDEVIVQVTREAYGMKVASVSCNINLTGKFCYVSSGNKKLGVSKKISRKDELFYKEYFSKIKPDEFGLVIRTNAINTDIINVENEANALFSELKELISIGIHSTCYSCLKNGIKPYIKDALSLDIKDTENIVTDCEDIYNSLLKEGFEIEKLSLYKDNYSLDSLYSFSNQIKKSLDKKVNLKCGGFIIIERTEALWVVDVNSGKYDKNTFIVNKEAALEISNQIKLRSMSGIIIIDFIDMKSKAETDELVLFMKNLLKQDSVPSVVYGMTALGLMEISRKKTKKPLIEQVNTNN